MNKLPTQEYLQQCFNYDPETGLLYWKARPPEHFRNKRAQAIFNGTYAGKETAKALDKDGYKTLSLDRKSFYTHRIIYKLEKGLDPEHTDHVNGNRADNKFDNLRSVSQTINMKNVKMYITNTSGVVGVRWDKNKNRWFAYIGSGKTKIHIGRFIAFGDAVKARKQKEIELGYHENHGRN